MRKTKTAWILAFLILPAFTPTAQSQGARFGLRVEPSMSVPITDSDIFGIGGGARLSFDSERLLENVRFGLDLGYTRQALKADAGSVSIVAMGASAAYIVRLLPAISLAPYADGGYFIGVLDGDSGSSGRSAYFGGGLGLNLSLTPGFHVSIDGGYRNFGGLFSSINAGICGTFLLGGMNGGSSAPNTDRPALPNGVHDAPTNAIRLANITFDPVFPILFKYYDNHPIGKAEIVNDGQAGLRDVTVKLFINQYMDNPKLCATIPVIDSGARATVDLYALFNEKLLDISEGTKVSAKVTVESGQSADAGSVEATDTVRIYDRNASMWDDDRKAAAFVTAKDPTVLRFSKNVLASVKDSGNKSINANLSTAIVLHEATLLYGLTYVTDPTNSYAATLENRTAVDFIQFPRQTFDYKAGNCSALSILYCALLESVGIETAFVTVPGHILMAVSLGITPAQARKDYSTPGDLIITQDRVWLPIETTDRNAGFIEAWQLGAREWREYSAQGKAALLPVHEAWSIYEPVGFNSEIAQIPVPPQEKLVGSYVVELNRYIDGEIHAQEVAIKAEIDKSNRSPASLNKLGVLYARYGLIDRAEDQFKLALKGGDFAPALLNLGNICFVRRQFEGALDYANRAQKLWPANPLVLLSQARVNHELENYGMAKIAYEKLKGVDPAMAEKYAYLQQKGEEGVRAAALSGLLGSVEWGE
jgi:hypothetical protein